MVSWETEREQHELGCTFVGSRQAVEVWSACMQVEYYKRRLLYVTAGLDRGFAASALATAEVEAAVASLTSATSPVVLSWTSGEPAHLHACSAPCCVHRAAAPT